MSDAASKRCLRLCQLPSGHGGPCSFSGPVCTCGSESFAGLECVCGASALLREEIERMANGASRDECSPELDRVIAALERIAAPKRPDGTYNLSREACEQIAREALRRD